MVNAITGPRLLHVPPGSARWFRFGLTAIVLLAGAYTVAVVILSLAGARPTIPVWLPIAENEYYSFETFFIGPLTIVLWIGAGFTAHLLARLAGGRGSLRGTLGLLGLAMAVASLATLIPDLGTGLLFLTGALTQAEWLRMTDSGPWQVVVLGYLALYVLAFVVLFPVAVRIGEDVSRRAAVAIGLVAFAVYQVPYLVVIR